MKKIFPLLLSLLCLVTFGCSTEKGKPVEKQEETFEIEKEVKRGPAVMTLRVDKKEISIADRLHLEIEVLAKEEYSVQLPEFGEKLEQFGIVDYRSPLPKLVDNGMMLYRKTYELEPFLSGEYRIPPMKSTFWKEGEEKRHEIESEEVTVTVTSLLAEEGADLSIREIIPPVELPGPDRKGLYLLAGAGVIALLLLILLVNRQRKRTRGETVVTQPAHEIAYEAMEKLIADNLTEKGEIKVFYLRLSNIFRHYIENRFLLRAPEQTTEEFLADLRNTDKLHPQHKPLLKTFLQHCDMVKFAELSPEDEEIQKTFDTCKRFIGETMVQTGGNIR